MKKGTSHKKELARLNRIAGQINGIAKMIEEDRYCLDILTQLKAVKSAIRSVERQVFDNHLGHCVEKAVTSKNEKLAREMVDEVKTIMKSMG